MKKTIWLSYDLGLRGDYEGLYGWLDRHDAKECGRDVAVLQYEVDGSLTDTLKGDLESSIQFGDRDRMYVAYLDTATSKMKGSFIRGRRKSPPWNGYAGNGEQTDVAEA